MGDVFRERAGLDQAHHEVCGTRLTPVVVQRDDVWVLEPGDELGFGLETADERRVIGELGPNHLDRHLTPDHRLVGAEHRPESAAPHLLAQFVTPYRQPRLHGAAGRRLVGEQVAVVDENPMFEITQGGRRLDPDLLDQSATERRTRAKRLRCAAAAIEGEHQRQDEPLPQRVLSGETLQLGHQLTRGPESQISVDPVLDRADAEFLESGDLGLCPRLVDELLVGVTTPRRQRRTKPRGCSQRIIDGDGPGVGH